MSSAQGEVAGRANPDPKAPQDPPGHHCLPATRPRSQPPAGQDATEFDATTIATGYRILHVQTSRAARVRLYTTPAKRAADAGRPVDPDPRGDHGVVVEVITTASLLALDMSPVPQGYSMEDPPTDVIPYRVTNLGSSGTVTVTLTWQPQEEI